jgi:hypothetical protein
MNPQMDVLYVKDLGHVLAGFTRASEPAQIEASALSFVGDGLHLRGLRRLAVDQEDFFVPSSQIALLRTNFDPSLLRTPRDWYVNLTASPLTVVESNQDFTAVASPTSITITSTSPPHLRKWYDGPHAHQGSVAGQSTAGCPASYSGKSEPDQYPSACAY